MTTRPIDWNKYTDFRSRHSRDDLAKVCSGVQRSDLIEIFSSPDKTGLCPIHWAAIHNRSDLIELMVENGSPIRSKCRNKLFADGTALHLAAMNGSIEAASMLLSKISSDSLGLKDWLRERDSEGQTPLMRSAAPRSKRLDAVWDLLRKNFWSLSGRPAEMALFLISKGADWRDTELLYGMNLMHLAIVNDYDDIVHMLFVLDKQLLTFPAKLKRTVTAEQPPTSPPSPPTSQQSRAKSSAKPTTSSADLESVNLDSSSSDGGGGGGSTTSKYLARQDDSSSSQPLISKQERADQLISGGLLPLQLAIVYGRLSVIRLLWQASAEQSPTESAPPVNTADKQPPMTSVKSRQRPASTTRELREALLQACWSNRDEFARLARSCFLKFALALDLALLSIIWLPVYLTRGHYQDSIFMPRSGVFILCYCLTMALAFRVMVKNPGYLRRGSVQYLDELRSIVEEGGHQVALPDSKVARKQDSETAKEKRSLEERVRLLCHKCQCIRRPRSRHCNYCNHCIQDFDHHCIYLGCCIGRKNRLDFLLMMLMVALTGIYGTVLAGTAIHPTEWTHFWHFVGFIWILKYALIGGLSGFLTLRRACLGVTMYEEIRSKRIRRIFGPKWPTHSISQSHRHYYSTLRGSFWRYSPDRFLTGDLPTRTILDNLKEYTNFSSLNDYLFALFCATERSPLKLPHNL